MNSIIKKDITTINNDCSDILKKLCGKTILVTGATGLIGNLIVNTLLNYSSLESRPKVIALVRNSEKAKKLYTNAQSEYLKIVVSDITSTVEIDEPVNYIIHGASQTSSKAFVDEPLETIQTAFYGTINMLNLAREKQVESFVYLSSMEVYGTPDHDDKINEEHGTNLNTMMVRTSYPESKRICESLCCAYSSEYNVPAKVVRLTQTFGPGVSYNDNRVFAEFSRCAIENRDIVLHTEGKTKRSYLYTTDAVAAILTVLINGDIGNAYNAANESTYCSIYDMAQIVAHECANDNIKVIIQPKDEINFGYAPQLKMNLDTSKLQSLGWFPKVALKEMFIRLCSSMKADKITEA